MEYNTISEIIDKQFRNGAFESNFFEKDDLISDLYLFLAEQDKEFTEEEILEVLKKKYKSYFKVYDIQDRNSYDKFERPLEGKDIESISSTESFVYDYFEKIIWGDNKTCIKCSSTNVIQRGKRYDCNNCGESYSFDKGTNLQGKDKKALQNLIGVYTLLQKGKICLKTIQDDTKLSKNNIENAFSSIIPTLINEKPLVRKLEVIPTKDQQTTTKFKEWEHQTCTINKAVEFFKDNNRGKVIHPCGSGKTYTAIEIVKKLDIKRLIVVIPSRMLLYQQIKAFKNSLPNHRFYAFGSLFQKPLKSNKIALLASSVEKQMEAIQGISKTANIVVFTTLKSFESIINKFPDFQLAIFDEAHRIAGPENKKYLSAVTSTKYEKALFLTATEKIFLNEGIGMNNEKFGETISNISLPEMIQNKIVLDYKILSIGFKSEEVRNILEINEEFFLDKNIKLGIKTRILVSALALIKSIQKYGIKKIITYHPTIHEAELFIEVYDKFQKIHGLDYNTSTINSKQTEFLYENQYGNFVNAEKAVISSVNCFQEGMDVRNTDAVLYGYPKKSKIDIVQSVGRCIRKYPNKKRGYVIIPSESEDYEKLIEVLNALETQDGRITSFKAKPNNSTFKGNIEFLEYSGNKLKVFDFKEVFKFSFIKGSKFYTLEELKTYLKREQIYTEKEYLKIKNYRCPRYPREYYRDWPGWKNIFKPEIYSYPVAKKYILENHSNIKTFRQYKKWTLKNDFPPNLPKDPEKRYGVKFRWHEFLNYKEGFLSFEEAIKWFVRNEILDCNTHEKRKDNYPPYIPQNPYSVYKGKWNWKKLQELKYISYEDAKKTIIEVNKKHNGIISSIRQYRKWKEGSLNIEFPKNILPLYPNRFYKEYNKEDFFPSKIRYVKLNYEDFIKYLLVNKVKNIRDFKNLPYNPIVPREPRVYMEWSGWNYYVKNLYNETN